MKSIFMFVVAASLASPAFATNFKDSDVREACHRAAMETVIAKKDLFQVNLVEDAGEGSKLHFVYTRVAADGRLEPMAAYLEDAQSRREAGYVDGRHLIYALYAKLGDGKSAGSGMFIVQCQGGDLSKVDDVNRDGKFDDADVFWVQDIVAQ